MSTALREAAGLASDVFMGPVNTDGARQVE
jgi:hypothetical protein